MAAVGISVKAFIQAIGGEAYWRLDDTDAMSLAQRISAEASPMVALEQFLAFWCRQSSRPTVLILDEVDALIGDTLISLLRQLRSGYPNRPTRFPQSIILCGVRDIKDYRIHSSKENTVITGGSAFNVKAESLRMGDFYPAGGRQSLAGAYPGNRPGFYIRGHSIDL